MSILIGIVLGVVLAYIIIVVRIRHATKLLRQADEFEKQGDLQNAIIYFKKLILAVAANKEQVPMWLARLRAIYDKQGIQAQTDEVLEAHRAIVDIWKSKMSDSKKRRLHRSAMEGMKAKLDALS